MGHFDFSNLRKSIVWLRQKIAPQSKRELIQEPADAPISDDNIQESRRGIFGLLAALFAIGSLPLLWARRAYGSDEHSEEDQEGPKKAKWGMVIDLNLCTGCQACVVSCRAENNVPVSGAESMEKGRAIFWMDMLSFEEGDYPDLNHQVLPQPCNHCDNPPCVKVCPVGTTYVNEEGIVAQIWARCIGCRYCITACPYTRRYFNWTHPHWPEIEKSQLNPDVATRPRGVVEKCTFCHQRIRATKAKARLEGRELKDKDFQNITACAQACPAKAIVFGDLNDPESRASHLSKISRAYRLQEDLGTRPKVYYLREVKWREQ